MIVAFRLEPTFLTALRLAARPDEDVVVGVDHGAQALTDGFPRLVVSEGRAGPHGCRDGGGREVPVLALDPAALERWRECWVREGLDRPWTGYLAQRLGPELARQTRPGWVDRTLADLAGLAGRSLPRSLGGLGRRVLEYPGAYGDLHGLQSVSGLTAGALKARFRRRSLPSPFSYLRWFRALATAHVLLESDTTVLSAAHRLGWTGGNLYRHLRTTTGFAPSEIRAAGAGERLLIAFAAGYLAASALDAWDSLDDLFLRRTA
jgi:AraC-like DNA-binding protein